MRRALSPAERLACAGAIAVAASLLLPWYGIPFSHGLSVTGWDRFGFVHAALLVTVGAAVLLIVRDAAGHPLARPLSPVVLVIAAGAWATLLTVFLMIDRPDELANSSRVGLRLGAYVALGGSVTVVLAGLRMRIERSSSGQ